jgi:3-hydroxyacyl-[acyl-carrier-protein] dehydratase
VSSLHLPAADIHRLLPHRGAALFIEEAWLHAPEGDGQAAGAGRAAWHAAHPVLQGHFPGLSIVPGIFLVEAVAQLAGVLLAAAARRSAAGTQAPSTRVGVLSAVRKSLIHCPVRPGERVDLDVLARSKGAGFFQVEGHGRVDGRKAATVEVVIGVVDPSVLTSA